MVRKTVLVLAATFMALITFAQAPKVLRDTGLYKLSVFEGTWQASDATPGVAAGTGPSAEYSCHWSTNKKFLVCDQMVTNQGKKSNNLSIYSYDQKTSTYKLSLVGVGNMEPFTIPVLASRDTLFYNSESTNGGVKTYYRTLNVFNSPSSYTYLVQSSKDKITWVTSMQGKATKVGR